MKRLAIFVLIVLILVLLVVSIGNLIKAIRPFLETTEETTTSAVKEIELDWNNDVQIADFIVHISEKGKIALDDEGRYEKETIFFKNVSDDRFQILRFEFSGAVLKKLVLTTEDGSSRYIPKDNSTVINIPYMEEGEVITKIIATVESPETGKNGMEVVLKRVS